jgi:long-chain fatty acid transport protein
MGHLGARSVAVAVGMAASVFLPATAWSTEGYFQLGFSPVQNSLGGAGVANSEDAMSMALNPAGLVGIGQQFQAGVGLFMPYRGYTADGTGLVAPGGGGSGTVDSSSNLFFMPNMAYSHPIDADSAWGVVLYGNGGMNTTYKNIANVDPPPCAGGVFCAGDAGVDLMQAFLSFDYARRFGNISVGIAPTLAVQSFKAKGLAGFAKYSSDPTNLSDNGYDWSYGGGLRAGIQADITKQLRLALSGQTQMWMTKFSKYSGLFADQGSFDIPASITAGVAYDINTRLTVMADFQRIFYSGVGAVSNSSNTPLPFGATDGPGFGWHDVNVYKIGVEYRPNDTWTFRAGYAYSDNPVQSADVMLNILAPGVVQHHFTAGATYKFSKKDAIDFAFVYAPEVKLSGAVPGGDFGGGTVELNMHQFIGQVGWTHNF